ncbi:MULTISPECIES: two-component system response regulator [Janthinobacterium]|uniref:Two-component system response regulator n=2 Tax=Janthinobacterium TaxID=29580 RepID=A0ABZ2GMK7_9BURK|nr:MULTISPECIES: two-component system response regulator [Janthinobacterium]PHV35246.1 two-component system response regulator [Janthinobacterium sp. BJB312]EZP37490.1 Response regulator receiver modulated metal dependent phosphohydrolase [Janthinobacterium lividum]MBW3500176.1 two-component system response regulator [Janthinobacterium sp. NKUCC08_JDC]OBV41156.1 putative two-component system response regulator [Janthinobacterium psychrotolerans]PJJ17010.1 putative two-component system response
MNSSYTRPIRPVILVVDDTPDNLLLMANLLKDSYTVKAANNGEKALRIARDAPPPDLILLDIMMPGMTGHEVAQALQGDPATRDIPIIFLTAMASSEDETHGLELGAADYITKPISPPVVLARVRTQLKVKDAADFLRDKNEYLEQEVQRRTRELGAIQDVTIHAMASLAETRDNETGNHIRRTQHYVKVLAEHLSEHPRFRAFLDPDTIKLLFKSAPLHDIGKIGIPDRILLKPGRFEPEEFEIMKTHTTLGRDAIAHAEQQLGMDVDFLRLAKEIAYSHQEKWDGSGYPEGLAGDAIPISARLMAVADVYDALISRRVYKEGMPHEKAVQIIAEGRGSHFDPDVCDAFLANLPAFQQIAARYADSDQDMAKQAAAIAHTLPAQ